MHPNLKNLSHSSRDLLHLCPRKYRIYKLSKRVEREEGIDTNFGSCVGVGVQSLLLGESREQAIWRMFLIWSGDLLSTSADAEANKKKKHFWHTVGAIDSFAPILSKLKADGWELASFKGKPAVELSFRIQFGEEFLDRGFVDAVLVNRNTLELMVLELKTTASTTVLDAAYGNSQQGVGYGVVLDAIAKQYESLKSSYKVLYLVYKTKLTTWEAFPFQKTYLQRAQWLQQVFLDMEMIKLYDAAKYWPMHGENCVQFFRACEYYGMCNMSEKNLLGDEKDIPINTDAETEFVFDLHVRDLLEAQLERQQ